MQVLNQFEQPILLGGITGLVPQHAYGIVLSITPTDNTYPIELYRAPDDGAGNPDTGNAILADSRLFAAHGDVFADMLPNDNAKRFYRWRHVVAGGTAGSYTAWVWARPDFLPQTYTQPKTLVVPLRSMPLADGSTNLAAQDATGQTAAADVYVPTANTVKVGTLATPSALTKTLRIPFAQFMPAATTTANNYSTGLSSILPLTANTVAFFRASTVLPKGVTVTQLAMRASRNDATNDFAEATLYSSDDSAAATLLATCTHTGTGKSTVTAALSQLVGSEYYIIQVQLNGFSVANHAFLQYCELTYTMPSYDKGY